jgi:hypothetical protein
MAITNASTLAEYASGIGTQNATLTVDANNKRVGVGTTNPLGTFQVGTGVTFWGDAGIGSFTSLKLSGTTDSTSTSTGALVVTGGVGIGLSLTVGGDVSVGGTITYEDVTNVDSIGIVTARSGVRVVGGGVTCVGVATFFNDIDANGALDVAGNISIADKIIHTGDTDTAIRFPGTDIFTIETGGAERLRVDSAGLKILDKLIHFGDTDTAIRFPAADTFTVETAGTERVRVSSAGSFAIGDATEPGARLYVNGLSTNDIITARAADTNGNSVINILSVGTAGNSRINFSDTAGIDGWVSYNHSARRLNFAAGGTSPQAYLDSSGRLLLGTTTEGHADADNLTVSSSARTGITIRSADDNFGNIYFSDGTSGGAEYAGYVQYSHENNYLLFGSNATDRMRIDADGHVMIGTTTEGFATYGDQFTIANSGHCGMTIRSGTSNYGTLYFSDGDDGSAAEVRGFVDYNHTTNAMQLGTDGSTRVKITATGLVGINTTVPTAMLSFGVKRSTQTYPPICFQADYGPSLADAAISTTDDSGGVDIMIGSNVYMAQNGTFTRYTNSYGSAAVRCQYTGNTLFYNKSGNNAPEESMRINGDGEVGIGTNNPTKILDVLAKDGVTQTYLEKQSGSTNNTYQSALTLSARSTGAAAADYGPAIGFQHAFGGSNYAGCLIASQCESDANTASLRFYPRNYGYTERMRITPTGLVGINTATAGSQGQLVVRADSGNTMALIKGGGSGAMALGSGSGPTALVEGVSGGGVKIYTSTGTWATPSWTAKWNVTPSMVDNATAYQKHSGSGQICRTFAGSVTLADGAVANIICNTSGYNWGFFEIFIQSAHGSLGRAYWKGSVSRYSGDDNFTQSNSMGYTSLDHYQDGVNNNGIRLTRTGTYGNVSYNFWVKAYSANATSNFTSGYTKYTEGAW